MYPHIFINPSNYSRIRIEIDGINIKAEQVNSEKVEIEDSSIFYTTIHLRNSAKIIPYLLIDKLESTTEYKLSNLRDPKVSSELQWSLLEDGKFELTEIKLRFSEFNKYGGMIWKGTM